jgi:prepilin-type N-terminal cleavage/methylation domain-containing protein
MRHVSRQDGFTLIELIVGMALSLVILFATLTILDSYMHDSTINTQNNDAQSRARVAIDRAVWQLRNIASPITQPKLLERATPYDIVFQTIGAQQGGTTGNVSGDERVRYCVPNDTAAGSSTNEVLIRETQTWNTAIAPPSPWGSDPTVTIPCPDVPLPSGPNGTWAVTASRQVNWLTNRYQGRSDRPAFYYNNGTLDNNSVAASDLPDVSSVQIDLFVNPTPTQPTRESELRSSAFLRNQTHSPAANFTYTDQGGGSVLLNGATSYSPDGYDLSYGWSCISAGCPAASTLAASTDGLVSWEPGPGTYTVQLTVTDPNGLTGTSAPQQVVVQ